MVLDDDDGISPRSATISGLRGVIRFGGLAELLTPIELARVLGVSPGEVHRLAGLGLPAEEVEGSRWHPLVASVRWYVQQVREGRA